MKISVGLAVALCSVLLFGGVATSSIADGKKVISKEAQEKALAYQEKGSKLDDEGEFDKAVIEYKKSLDYNPDDPNTLFNLGVVYLKINKASEAEKVFEKLVNLLPNDTEVINLLGVAYSGNGKKAEAIKTWERSLAIEPQQSKVKEMISELKTAAADIKK